MLALVVLGAVGVACGQEDVLRPRRRKRRPAPPPVESDLRDSLSPLPTAAGYRPPDPYQLRRSAEDPAYLASMMDGGREPPAAEGPWIGRYDVTSSDPLGPRMKNGFIDSMVDTGNRKPGLVNVGDGIGRIVLTPIVTTARASGAGDAVKRVAFAPFATAIGAFTGAGQVGYGLLKTVTSDLFGIFKTSPPRPRPAFGPSLR